MEKNSTTQYDAGLWNLKPATTVVAQAIRLSTMTRTANAPSVGVKGG
jgi:hypothetical protein